MSKPTRRPPDGVSPREREDRLATPLAELDLPLRIVNSLEGAGLFTIKDLVALELDAVKAVDNLGAKAVSQIIDALGERGVYPTSWGVKPSRKG